MPPSRLVILGDPVSHSLSPKFQTAAISAAGLDIKYEPLRVSAEDLERVALSLREEGAGGNVTVPHKIAFSRLCSERTETAERTGSVNTFWTENGELFGDNTDVAGFDAAARELLGDIPAGLAIAVIGAGGAASGVLAAIEKWPEAKVALYSRTGARADALAKRFGDFVRVNQAMDTALKGATLVVNATPVGMADGSLPFEIGRLSSGAAVLDLVYRPGGTALVQAARRAGHRAADGTTMLIEQGAKSFERWFGFAPEKRVMRAALA